MDPSLSVSPNRYRVALVGEALGEKEAVAGYPFQGPAGFKLTRLIEWAGLDRGLFDIWNTVWCRPPENKLEGESYEQGAVNHCKGAHWDRLLDRVDVVVPLGNVPLSTFTGRKGILKTRGYIQNGPNGKWLVPTVHPSFINRGQSKYSAAFIYDLQKAVKLAQEGFQFERQDYLLDPLPIDAYRWATRAVEHSVHTGIPIAFDIETPGKGEDEGDVDADDPTYFIWRIGFSYAPLNGLSIPWDASYIPAIKLIMESTTTKVVWNAEFDCPRIRHNGVEVNGLVHDGMVAWHILHSDLPKGLGFVATFTCPFQPMWKHLSHASPAYYNATDADVELRSWLVIEEELKRNGLWRVYERDVIDLDPILQHMKTVGMPVDGEKRVERAVALATKQAHVLKEMETLVPEGARKIEKVFVNEPTNKDGLRSRPGVRTTTRCSGCGLIRPGKPHFKRFVKKVNPCCDAHPEQCDVDVDEWYRYQEFTPSRNQIIRYNQFLNRQTPTTYDKKTKSRKVTTNEKAIKQLMVKYPTDPFYPKVLEYRALDKIGGTYIGRPNEVPNDSDSGE